MTLVVPRSVVDTTAERGWDPMTVRVTLDEPLVGDLAQPLYLDGPLAWCAYLEHIEGVGHRPPPMQPQESPLDFELGLATWTATPTAAPIDGRALGADGMAWGHACSAHTPVPAARTAVSTRRPPNATAHTRYTPDRRHHLAAGPYKARDVIHPAAWVGTITWHALGDPDRVSHLLTRLRHMGRLAGHGYGRVAHIEVVPGADRDGWRARPMPHPDGHTDGVRAPYHHTTRQMPCRV